MTKFYMCLNCKMKVSPTFLGEHWLDRHFSQMYMAVRSVHPTLFHEVLDHFECMHCHNPLVQYQLKKHWLNKHFQQLYSIVDTESQETFNLDTETGKITLGLVTNDSTNIQRSSV